MKDIFLSVVIPCYNESENLQRGVLDEVDNFLKRQDFTWEVIVSDDGSTDDSRGIVAKQIRDKKNFRLVENLHGGKPSAIWGGIKNAVGDYVLFTDMDQSAPIKELLKLIPYFTDYNRFAKTPHFSTGDEGKERFQASTEANSKAVESLTEKTPPFQGGEAYKVVIGSRGSERENFSMLRKLGSTVFRLFRKSLMLADINDTQCGFKAFRSDVAKKIFPMLQFFKHEKVVKGWKVTSFDVELLFIAEKLGYKIREVPVEWKDRDVTKGKRKSYFKESKEMLMQILRVKLNDLHGLYDK